MDFQKSSVCVCVFKPQNVAPVGFKNFRFPFSEASTRVLSSCPLCVVTLSLHSLTWAPMQHPLVSIATNVLHRDNCTLTIQTFRVPALRKTWGEGQDCRRSQNDSPSLPFITGHYLKRQLPPARLVLPATKAAQRVSGIKNSWHNGGSWRECWFKLCYL